MPGVLRRIIKKFYSLPVRDKVFLPMVGLLVLTIGVFLFSINSIIRNRLILKTTTSTNQNLVMISEKLNLFFERIQSDSVVIIASDQCQKVLNMVEDDAVSRYKQNKLIQSTMMSVFVSDAVYKSIIYYDNDGNCYMLDRIITNDEYLTPHREKIQEFISSGENECWLSSHKSPYSERRGDIRDCISYLRKVYGKNDGRLLGVMETEIELSKVTNLYSALLDGNIDVFIVGSDGRIISSEDTDRLYKDISDEKWYRFLLENEGRGETFKGADGAFFYISKNYEKVGWLIIARVPTEVFFKDVKVYTLAAIMIGVALFLVTAVISRFLAHSITRPIKKITEAVLIIAGGNYKQRVKVETSDEIGILSMEFNRMLDTTNQLMSRIVEKEKQKREYELSLMQMQMTPHFLYNIFESICGLIVTDDKKTAIKTINLVSNFYRGVLSKGREIVTIEDEVSLSRYYLEVLKICHPGTFEYSIDIDPEVAKCQINKLTLQPILENSIQHGILSCGHAGIISISAYREKDKAIIKVYDNGQGMKKEMLGTIQAGRQKEHHTDSFGLKNTDDRIKLYFGEGYGVKISSVYGKGTEVRIELPYYSGEDKYCIK
ncbi:MAG: cache domain-containing sensor histidine kinase [Acetivibrionales bacterium]